MENNQLSVKGVANWGNLSVWFEELEILYFPREPWAKRTASHTPCSFETVSEFESTVHFVPVTPNRISTPKRKKNTHNFEATPIRFTALSCKKQHYYAPSCSSEEPWRSHSTAICRNWIAKRYSTASTARDKKSPEDLIYGVCANRDTFDGKATTSKTAAQASQVFCATERPFTPKKTMCLCKS